METRMTRWKTGIFFQILYVTIGVVIVTKRDIWNEMKRREKEDEKMRMVIGRMKEEEGKRVTQYSDFVLQYKCEYFSRILDPIAVVAAVGSIVIFISYVHCHLRFFFLFNTNPFFENFILNFPSSVSSGPDQCMGWIQCHIPGYIHG